MSQQIRLKHGGLPVLRQVDERLASYNIEMTEVTGGTFWKAYTPAQIAGTEPFPAAADWDALGSMMQYYPPVDLYNPRLRALSKSLGPAWVRVSGGWATDTYYDFDGHTGGKVPEGYKSVLTKEQWIGVLDFVKAVGCKLLTSMALPHGRWVPDQAKLLFDFSREYGVPIHAVEYVNEPNVLGLTIKLPDNYPAIYAADQDEFARFVRSYSPQTLIVGPCASVDSMKANAENRQTQINAIPTEELMAGAKEMPDVFSYHHYNGISERGAIMGGHWPVEAATSEAYLAAAPDCCRYYMPMRDRMVPGGQIWVTESGDAGCGGSTWASTYLDVIRTLHELGSFAALTDGVIFHNTLASSDYGLLAHDSFEPRPNYFAMLFWKRLMGNTVFDAGSSAEGSHLYAHSRRDGKEGIAYLVINNSTDTPATVDLPKAAETYILSADTLRSPVMKLNGRSLVLEEDGSLPAMEPVVMPAGSLTLAPAACAFLIL